MARQDQGATRRRAELVPGIICHATAIPIEFCCTSMKSFEKPVNAEATPEPVKSSKLVCAWCHPPRSGEPVGRVSHGICPRHFEELVSVFRKLAAQNPAMLPVAQRARV